MRNVNRIPNDLRHHVNPKYHGSTSKASDRQIQIEILMEPWGEELNFPIVKWLIRYKGLLVPIGAFTA